MKNYLIVFSLLLFAFVAKGEGKNLAHSNSLLSMYALSGSGSLDIEPFQIYGCTGSGTVDLNFNPGITDMVLWNDGSSDIVRVGLTPGDYSVLVTIDDCDSTYVFNVPDVLTATVTNFQDKNCVEGTASNPSFGSFDVNPVGGEGPYTYSINEGPFQSSNTFGGLEAGTYTVDVLDANGCETQVSQRVRCIGCSIAGNPVQRGDQFLVDVFFGDASETAELTVHIDASPHCEQRNTTRR